MIVLLYKFIASTHHKRPWFYAIPCFLVFGVFQFFKNFSVFGGVFQFFSVFQKLFSFWRSFSVFQNLSVFGGALPCWKHHHLHGPGALAHFPEHSLRCLLRAGEGGHQLQQHPPEHHRLPLHRPAPLPHCPQNQALSGHPWGN